MIKFDEMKSDFSRRTDYLIRNPPFILSEYVKLDLLKFMKIMATFFQIF